MLLQFTHTCGKEEKKSWPQDHTATNIHSYWFCWSIVWERKGDGPSCKYHVSLFHRDIGPKYGVPSKSDTVLDEDIDVISITCFFSEGFSAFEVLQVFKAANFRSKKDKKEKKGQKETVEEQDSPEAKTRSERDGRPPFWSWFGEIWREHQLNAGHLSNWETTRITDPRWCRVSAIDHNQ